MKKLKTLTLSLVAVAAVMAVFGAGSAAATETSLCKQPTTFAGLPRCEGNHLWLQNTRIHAELEAGKVLTINTPNGVVVCKKSTIDAFTEQTTWIPLGANVGALTFGECEDEGEPVEVFALKNGTLDIEIIDLPVWTHNGTLTLTGAELKVFWIGTGVECRYDPGHVGTLTGGAMATIDLFGTLTNTGGVLCPPGNAVWNGAYTVTSPEPLWVSM